MTPFATCIQKPVGLSTGFRAGIEADSRRTMPAKLDVVQKDDLRDNDCLPGGERRLDGDEIQKNGSV